MTRLSVGPFSRIEGDLEIGLDVENGAVRDAYVATTLYRGLEQILQGRHPGDALVIAPRICGACSMSHSAAAATALADLSGARPPPNGQLAANILQATEMIADHLSHFYFSFMPDLVGPAYADKPWHEALAKRFAAIEGTAHPATAKARARLLHIMGVLGGKWPHGLAIQTGGTTKAADAGEKIRLLAIISEFRRFLEEHVFADDIRSIVDLGSADDLTAWRREMHEPRGDFGLFLDRAEDLGLDSLGRGPAVFMSYGGLPDGEGRLFGSGLWNGHLSPLDPCAIVEDVTHSWMAGRAEHPWEGATRPDAEKATGYTWCKAPRIAGGVVEVGPQARQVVDGQPLMLDLVSLSGSNVRNRLVAKLVEIARLTLAIERWIRRLRPREPFYAAAPLPSEGRGIGLVEGARGSLGHWLSVGEGRIANYQVIAPATWVLSPRDATGVPGPLEQALVAAPVRPGDKTPVSVQHVVRSFAPCAACATH